MGAAYTQTGVLAKGRAKDSAEEMEELGRPGLKVFHLAFDEFWA